MSREKGRHGIVSITSSSARRMKSTEKSSLACPKPGPTLLLSCLLAGSFCCCVVAAQLSRVDLVPAKVAAATAEAAEAPKEDASARLNDDKILFDHRDWILLMALKEFCASSPLECQSVLDNCTLADDPLRCNPSAWQTAGGDSSGYEQLPVPDMGQERGNQTGGWDELAEGQSIWLPRLGAVESEREIGAQVNQQRGGAWRSQGYAAPATENDSDDLRKRLLNMLEHYYETGDGGQGRTLSASGVYNRPSKAGGKFKRDREFKQEQQQKRRTQQHHRDRSEPAGKQQANSSNTNNNKQGKHRLTVEEAKRIIRAFRRDRAGLVAAPSSSGRALAGTGNGLTSRDGDLRVVPKRTGLSGDEMRLDSGGGENASGSRGSAASIITTKTSGPRLGPEPAALDALVATPSSAGAGNTANNPDDDSLQCNMRRFIYRATKTDQAGNQCTGLITANICYGACDTGEIADWLFPHKKPIHKVCRHGGRIRRMARLTDCATSSGLRLALDGAPDDATLLDLQQYHFVDALDCVCRRCTSADTTCLGTMSRPSLPTLAEIGHNIGNRDNDDHEDQVQKYRQQISSMAID